MSRYTPSVSNCQRFIEDLEAEDDFDFVHKDEPEEEPYPEDFDTLAEYYDANQNYAIKKYVPGWHERQQKLKEERRAVRRKQKSDAIRAECSRPELAAGVVLVPGIKTPEIFKPLPLPIKDEIWEYF